MDKLEAEYPVGQLLTSGENVGLPDGQMGNSEVGHLNIGAGKLPEIGSGLGKGIKNFKKATKDEEKEKLEEKREDE